MAKLNNGGWGIGNMIGFLLVFLVFFLIIIYLVYTIDHEENMNIQLVDEGYVVFLE